MCVVVGVHWRRPVVASMVIPGSAVRNEKVSVSPASGSVASTS
jgi:hypothetical protein